MLLLLQIKGLYRRLAQEDPYDHIQNFVDVCGPFSFKNISQDSFSLWLINFPLFGEDIEMLADSSRD